MSKVFKILMGFFLLTFTQAQGLIGGLSLKDQPIFSSRRFLAPAPFVEKAKRTGIKLAWEGAVARVRNGGLQGLGRTKRFGHDTLDGIKQLSYDTVHSTKFKVLAGTLASLVAINAYKEYRLIRIHLDLNDQDNIWNFVGQGGEDLLLDQIHNLRTKYTTDDCYLVSFVIDLNEEIALLESYSNELKGSNVWYERWGTKALNYSIYYFIRSQINSTYERIKSDNGKLHYLENLRGRVINTRKYANQLVVYRGNPLPQRVAGNNVLVAVGGGVQGAQGQRRRPADDGPQVEEIFSDDEDVGQADYLPVRPLALGHGRAAAA